ncbi:TonB family protein [bacterium]|nr:TonB family protein [bacterium]MBU1994833.1 TonB family protein [bacterium]
MKQELKSAPLIQEAPVEKMKETAKQIPVVKEKKVREEKITKIEKKEQPKKVENVKSENVKVKTEEIKIIEDAKVLRVAESNQTIVSQKQIQAPVQEKPVAQKVSPEIKYIDEHITEITKLLEDNLYYPRAARKRGIVGNVIVKFKLSQDGSASFIKVVASKDEILSRAAIKTIEDLSGKFPKPNEDIVIKVPIDYDLK